MTLSSGGVAVGRGGNIEFGQNEKVITTKKTAAWQV